MSSLWIEKECKGGIPEGCPQSISDPPTHCIGAAGVLRYNRESDNHGINLTTILQAPLTEYPVRCEYCGEEAKPSLDLTWVHQPETVFCCARWQQLCEMLVKQTCLVGWRCDLSRTATPTTQGDNKPATETEELLVQAREMEDGNKFVMELPQGFGYKSGIDGAEFLQKTYSKGMKFLTVFPDGSAQVFYPSGLLAVVVVVTEENGRVCIVYDDSDAPCQPIRAVFLSDGRSTCYHRNGNIWLALNTSGGQCLDEKGARVRQWSWSSLSPTPLHPIFLSLNKTVGVRVLGRAQVFVSFLARGQQAKFSVGTCCTQGECKTNMASSGPSLLKEELFVSAARIRIHLAFLQLHQYLRTPSRPRLPKTSQVRHLHAVAQRLLAVSADVMMSERDRAFIHRCLRDCL
ncbi:glutamate-rich protein 6 [Pagrus major]|uniref:glutamate-rich protein 6 n=1 Tax=Pagrus major TaxID=143350 RepID=UPI003CC8CD80